MSSAVASQQMMKGGCLCGDVRFKAVLSNFEANACHCSMCRKWSAGPYLSVHCDSVEIADTPSLGIYRSSEWAERCFCKSCGTSLMYRMVNMPFYATSVEAFDDTSKFTFTGEIFIDEKPGYYNFANATKKMTGPEVMAAFKAKGDGG